MFKLVLGGEYAPVGNGAPTSNHSLRLSLKHKDLFFQLV